MRRLVTLGAAAVVTLCMAAPAHAVEITPVKVIDEPGTQQFASSGSEEWYAFTANSSAHPHRYNAYAELVNGTQRTRLNPKGTGAYTGNFDPGTNTVIYNQYSATTRSNLFFYDLDLSTRTQVPDVNTKWFEYFPRVSTAYVLFDRDRKVNGVWWTQLRLYDRTTHATTQIDAWKANSVTVVPGSVGATKASFEVIKFGAGVTITSYVYDIAGATRMKITVPSGKFAYSPSVDETNREVYFVRSGNGCGANVTIRRVSLDDPGGAQTVLASMPDGVDAGDLSLAPNMSSLHTDLLFTRYKCSNGVSHIFSLPGVDTV